MATDLKPGNLDLSKSSSKTSTERGPPRMPLFVVSHAHSCCWALVCTSGRETSQWAGLTGHKTRWGASDLPWKPRQEAEQRDGQIQMLSCLSRSLVSTSVICSYSTGSSATVQTKRYFNCFQTSGCWWRIPCTPERVPIDCLQTPGERLIGIHYHSPSLFGSGAVRCGGKALTGKKNSPGWKAEDAHSRAVLRV